MFIRLLNNTFLAIVLSNVPILFEPLIFFKLSLKFLVLGVVCVQILSHLYFRLFNLLFIETGRCLGVFLRHAQPGSTFCISGFRLTSISHDRWITTLRIISEHALHKTRILHCFETLVLIAFINWCILPWVQIHTSIFHHLVKYLYYLYNNITIEFDNSKIE